MEDRITEDPAYRWPDVAAFNIDELISHSHFFSPLESGLYALDSRMPVNCQITSEHFFASHCMSSSVFGIKIFSFS
jgi:hypothetical protein